MPVGADGICPGPAGTNGSGAEVGDGVVHVSDVWGEVRADAICPYIGIVGWTLRTARMNKLLALR